MKIGRWLATVILLTVSSTGFAQVAGAQTVDTPHGLSRSKGKALQTMIDAQITDGRSVDESELLEKSREAGLLTDWHLEGRFGHGSGNDFIHKFAPEQDAEKEAIKPSSRRFERRRYELEFAGGTFTLPQELASLKGVFYANSSTYLTGGGDWNVYLESEAQASVFVDGRQVVTRGPKGTGVLRAKIHVESGYHTVMVKFTAQAAPFRVAILPLNSGSRRKNNTPYLQASPASEYMMAQAVRRELVAGGSY